MTDYTLSGGSFTRTFTSAELAGYSVQLLASQQGHFKVDGVAFILLDPKGFLFVLQVDGAGSTPGRALFETYNFGWNRALEHSVELTDKTGLSSTFSLSQALTAHGHTFTTLDALHAFVYAEPPPGPPRYWCVDDSQDITQLVRKTTHNHAHRSTYLAPPEEHLSVQTKRQTITHYNSYTHAFTVSGLVVTALDLAGLYLENVSGTRYRIGVTSQRPVITLVNGNSLSVEAGSTWTDPGSSAVDEDGTAVQVTITGDVVDTSLLTGGTPYQIVYTAVSADGDRNSVVRQVHVVDTTSPTIVLLPHSSGDVHPTLNTGDVWVDPGYTATAGGSWENITHSQSGTVDVNTAGSYSLVVNATDGTNAAATITRTVTITPPYTWQSGSIYGYGSGNPTGASVSYVSHTITPSGWRGPSAAQAQDPDLVFERPYSSHSAGKATLGLGPNTLSSAFDGIVYDLGAQHYTRMIIKGFTFQGQVLDSGSNRLALYVKGSNSATGPWSVIAYQQSSYWPGLLNPPQTFSYNHPASSTTNNSTAFRYLAVGYGVVSGSLSTNTPDSGISRVCLTGDFFA